MMKDSVCKNQHKKFKPISLFHGQGVNEIPFAARVQSHFLCAGIGKPSST
jgi:hypothetical protein